MTNSTTHEEHTPENYPLHNPEYVNMQGWKFESFVEAYGEAGYQKVVTEFGGDATKARYHIEKRLVLAGTSLEKFMYYYLFDGEAGVLVQHNHPLLRLHVDFHELAVARWKAGYVRVVAHEGTFLFFDCRDEKRRGPFPWSPRS